MRSNMHQALLAVAVSVTFIGVVACGTASTRADDLEFSEFDARSASYNQSMPYEFGAIRAAFLSEEPLAPREPGRLRESIARLPKNGNVTCSATGDCGSSCECSPGTNFEIAPQNDIAMTGDGCPSCNCAAGSECELCQLDETCEGPGSVYYAELQIMWLRAHLLEDAVGKLSEQYTLSPRLIAGYENAHGVGARGRFWHYSHATPILGAGEDIQFRFDTIDLEATSRFAMRKADLVVSGGLRWANIEIELDDVTINTGAPGLTFAADLRTELCRKCNSQWAAIGGGRISTLGGDWEGSSGGFISPVRDDNMVVQEIYGGVEYTYCTEAGHSLYARLTFEIQNWHSDAVSQMAGADSIGFVGPGVHFGGSF